MANVFSMIPFMGGGGGGGTPLGTILIYTFFMIVICAGGLTLFFLILHMKRTTPIIEIDFVSRKLTTMRGMLKKDKKDGAVKLFVSKLKKALKRPQQQDFFLKRSKDLLMLLKDDNGLHHTLRLPKYEELKEYYLKVKGVDIEQPKISVKDEEGNNIEEDNPYYKNYEVFFLPNPHEDLEWLGNQIAEAEAEFKVVHWWQHPNFMVIGTAFICFMMIVMTMILK